MRKILKHDPVHCQGCPLFRDKSHRTTYVPTDVVYGSLNEDTNTPHADVLVIGEMPNKTEDDAGLPFSGKSGLELRTALQRAGLAESYALLNTVRCCPTDGEGNLRPATVEEIAACSNYARKDIEYLNPKVIVYIGHTSVQALADHPDWKGQSLGKLKGQIYKKDGRTHLVTLHPHNFIKNNNDVERKRFYRHISAIKRFVTETETPYSRKGKVVLVKTIDQFNQVMDHLMFESKGPIAFDFETKNLNHVAKNKVATLQLSADNDLAYTIPVDHWDSPWSPDQRQYVKRRLRDFFRRPDTSFKYLIAHNAQFDMSIAIRHLKLKRITKPVIDTQFLAYLEDENQVGGDAEGSGGKKSRTYGAFRLKTLAREYLGFYWYDLELSDALAARSGANGGSLWDMSLDRLSDYGGTDAYVTRRLFYRLREMLTAQEYTTAVPFSILWYSRIAHFLTKMSSTGLFMDINQLGYLRSDDSPILARLQELPKLIADTDEARKANDHLLGADSRTKGMRPLFGKKPWVLDIDKRAHRIALFVESCKLEALDEGADNLPRVNKAFLEHYKDHPIVKLYSEYSGLYKLRTSYLNSVEEVLYSKEDNRSDGRIHASFHASRTVTGRLSASDPNVHQLPRGDTPAKAAIKSLYGAALGHLFIEADYGQAEIRWWAQISGDRSLAGLFHDMANLRKRYLADPSPELKKRVELECDIHRQVAALMFGLSLADVTKPQRQRAKGLAFACIYGQSKEALALILGIDKEEAGELQQSFIRRFERAGRWLTQVERDAEIRGIVSTPHGRWRHLAPLFAENVGAGRRRARNSPVQAASSDTTALAAWRIQNWTEDNNKPYKVVNCVHDAISLEIPMSLDCLQDSLTALHDNMVNIDSFLRDEFDIDMIVPMEIDYKIGLRWGHMLGYDGMLSELPDIFEKCKAWDDELRSGVPWHVIALRDFADGKGKA